MRRETRMATAMDVAKHLVQLADSGPEPDELSHLRLQKLLYYSQGWSLALRGVAIFPESIEAWPHGPVVPHVYHQLKGFGWRSIPSDEIQGEALTEEDSKFVGSVWEAYKDFSATKLRDMTHKEDPWIEARAGCTQDGPGQIISHKSMRDFFREASKSERS